MTVAAVVGSDDVRKMFDEKEYLFAFDLDGRDVTVTISKVEPGKVGHGNRATKKPILSFKGKRKKLAVNATNVKTIASLVGSFKASDWIGKTITLYPTTTSFGGETVDCIRVRNRAGSPDAAGQPEEGGES